MKKILLLAILLVSSSCKHFSELENDEKFLFGKVNVYVIDDANPKKPIRENITDSCNFPELNAVNKLGFIVIKNNSEYLKPDHLFLRCKVNFTDIHDFSPAEKVIRYLTTMPYSFDVGIRIPLAHLVEIKSGSISDKVTYFGNMDVFIFKEEDAQSIDMANYNEGSNYNGFLSDKYMVNNTHYPRKIIIRDNAQRDLKDANTLFPEIFDKLQAITKSIANLKNDE